MATNHQNDILVRLNDDCLMLDDPSQDVRDRNVFDRDGKPIGHGYYGYSPYWSPGYIYPGISGIY